VKLKGPAAAAGLRVLLMSATGAGTGPVAVMPEMQWRNLKLNSRFKSSS
jgi:hypothetical protein